MDRKELKSLLKLLRENGVISYKTPELELTILSDAMLVPELPAADARDAETDEITNEQLMFYSAGDLG